jgi:HEAT repeat protein
MTPGLLAPFALLVASEADATHHVARACERLMTADATSSSVAAASEERRMARAALVAPGAAAVPALVERLSDPRFTVRWEATNALGILRDARALEPLVGRVLEDEDAHVRWRATWALSAVDARLAAEQLRRARDRGGPGAWRALVALAVIAPSADLAPDLEAGLGSADAWVRWEAAFCLRRAGRPESGAALERALADPDERVRREARRAVEPAR